MHAQATTQWTWRWTWTRRSRNRCWDRIGRVLKFSTSMRAGDDAVDLALDTDEVLAHPLLGPLTRSAVGALAPGMDPAEVTQPIGKDPLLGLPTIVPLPRLERIYFKCAWFLVTFLCACPWSNTCCYASFGKERRFRKLKLGEEGHKQASTTPSDCAVLVRCRSTEPMVAAAANITPS